MPSEVTMKDLQSLQGYVNKQDADLRKQLSGLEADLENLSQRLKGTDKVIELKYDNWGIGDMKKRLAALEATIKGLSDMVAKVQRG